MRSIFTFCAVLLVFAPAESSMAVSVFSSGFEGPEYAPGKLVGQQGWDDFPFPDTDGAATIQTGIVKSGLQAIKIATEDINNDGQAIFHQDGLNYSGRGQILTFSFDIRLDPDPQADDTVWMGALLGDHSGRLFAFGLKEDRRIAYTMPTPVDGIDYTDVGSELHGLAPPSHALPFQTWHRMSAVINVDTKAVEIYIDGMLQTTPGAALRDTSDVIRGIGLSMQTDGTVFSTYFDDFSLTAEPIPEPKVSFMLAAGWLLALRRKRLLRKTA